MTTIVFSRIPEDESSLVKRICELRGESMSSFIRRSLRKELAYLSYLPVEQKKALGVV